MAKRKFKFRRKPINIINQVWNIRSCYPNFKVTHNRNKCVAIGMLQPTVSSTSYKVKIEYKFRDSPKVYVLSPPLLPYSKGVKIPHMYGPNRPCIYLPKSGQWGNDRLLARTIIPWLSLWLFYYEVWFITGGDWLGGGLHPQTGEKDESET